MLDAPLQLWIGTVIVGDVVAPPVLRVVEGFVGECVVCGREPGLPGTNGFYIGLKNVVVDSTAVGAEEELVLVDWTVSQGTQLTGVSFVMPAGGRHVGLRYVSSLRFPGFSYYSLVKDMRILWSRC